MPLLPEIFSLDFGESRSSLFGGEKSLTIKLISYECDFGKLYGKEKWYDIFHRAEIKIEFNGSEYTLICRPYQMPVQIEGVWIQADMLREVSLGAAIKSETVKAIRFSASASKWWERDNAVFPVKDYIWRSSIFRTHTYNGFVQLQGDDSVYYHGGEDFALQKDKHALVSPADGKIMMIPGSEGDGKSNSIIIEGDDISWRFAHCNADRIRSDLEVGDSVSKGEFVGRTGNTWNGHPVPGDHLHWGMSLCSGEESLNTFPFAVALYQKQFPDEILPVAGGFRFCRAGETITHDACCSITPAEKNIRYRWSLHDGTNADGVSVDVSYSDKGSYCEILEVTDEDDQRFHDVVLSRVTDETCSTYPMAFINYYPVRDIHPGMDIDFYVKYWGMGDLRIDFGDGSEQKDFAVFGQHAYEKAGTYIVVVTGEDNGNGPGIFKLVVNVV